MQDKIKVKDYIAKLVGKEHVVPLLLVWNKAEEINFDLLPNQFVIKCSHNSGLGMCICTDKSKLDRKRVIRQAVKGLREDFYQHSREWAYKDIERRVFAETYLETGAIDKLIGIKFYCFNGIPAFFYVSDSMVCF